MQITKNARLWAASLAVPMVLLAGCGGGGNGSSSATATPSATATSNVASTNVVALTSDNRLIAFNAQTPGTFTTLALSGVTGQLQGIDYRYAPDAAGTAGLYAISRISAGSYQLFSVNLTTGAATAVGSAFSLALNSNVGFDFNPNVPSAADATVRVDRIRLVSIDRKNLRLVPNTGAIVDNDATTAGIQLDGTLAYASTDSNASVSPRVVGAAYTNNDTDLSTGTVNYAVDNATGNLATQGTPATATAATVSPNTGQLFTIGSLGIGNLGINVGFDIGPTNNLALLSNDKQLYTVNLTTGAATSLGTIGTPSGTTLRGLAIVP